MNFDVPDITTDADYFNCKLYTPHNIADLPHYRELLPHRMDNLLNELLSDHLRQRSIAFGSLFFLDRPFIFRHFPA